VIKAAGLAKGKGVIVPATLGEAVEALDRIMVQRVFGDAGKEVVIEERLEGTEVSVLALVDGRSIYVLETCQDHKRLRDNDEGPNTGGMGAFCPAGTIDDAMMTRVQEQVLVPTLDALRREGIDYRGVLYAGLMLTPAGPKVLEFNCRFGDPECQALLVRLESDLLELILATCQGRLGEVEVRWKPGASCCVVMAAPGYPEEPRAGLPITGVDTADAMLGVNVFHAGTKRDAAGKLVTAGGRVLSVTATGSSLVEARTRAYAACDAIQFEGKQVRRDIGVK
jgi:phosphoribosylamine--glycine ligase